MQARAFDAAGGQLVIGALNGHTVGGGLEIAMACDIRIAKKGAGKVGLPEINLGVLPGTGGTQRFARIVGRSKAIELMVTGDSFSMEDAKEMGIINQIFEGDDFMDQIMTYAKQFCPPNKAALAAGRIKRSVQSGLRSASKKPSPWSANCSNSSSKAATPKKAWTPTSTSASPNSPAASAVRG